MKSYEEEKYVDKEYESLLDSHEELLDKYSVI